MSRTAMFNTKPTQQQLCGSLTAALARPVAETYPSLSWGVSPVQSEANGAEIRRFDGAVVAHNLDKHTPGGREVHLLT